LLYLRRGPDYAPITVGIVLLAWWLTAVLTPFLFRSGEADQSWQGAGKKQYLVIGSRMLVAIFYQNALFFLVFLWTGSVTLGSINIVIPCLLAGMALFSCFDHAYRFFILRHTLFRSISSAIVLFSISAIYPISVDYWNVDGVVRLILNIALSKKVWICRWAGAGSDILCLWGISDKNGIPPFSCYRQDSYALF
jgi:hypothetical protein